MGLVRGFADNQDCPAEFLQEEERRLDRRSVRFGAGAVGSAFGFKSTVIALMGKGHINATPGIIGGGQVVCDDGRDHGPATSALRPGFGPTADRPN